jgi:4-hydroxy-tetrahydrodipicolinate synthase
MATDRDGTTSGRWEWEAALAGIVPPMVTPLDADGQVDAAAVGRVVDHILGGGCSGLFVAGGVGEGAWLSTAQRGAIVEATAAAARGRVPVLAGCMLPGTAPVLDAVRQAEAAGADAIVVGSPYYFDAGADGQLRHVRAVLAATRLPVLLYNIPQCVGTMLAFETVAALAREPRVLGIKDSSGDLGYFQQLLTLKQDRPSFRVLQGNETVASSSLLLGGDGLIPGYGNIVPDLYTALHRAARAGDVESCRRIQRQINELNDLGGELPDIKAAVEVLGLMGGTPAPPFAPRSSEQKAKIRSVLARLEILPGATV